MPVGLKVVVFGFYVLAAKDGKEQQDNHEGKSKHHHPTVVAACISLRLEVIVGAVEGVGDGPAGAWHLVSRGALIDVQLGLLFVTARRGVVCSLLDVCYFRLNL